MNATTSEKQNPENLGINLDGRLDVREKKDFKQYIRENKDQLYPVGLQALEKAKVWEMIESTDADAMNNEQLLMVQMLWNILLQKGVVTGSKVSVDSYIGPQTRNAVRALKDYRQKDLIAKKSAESMQKYKTLQQKGIPVPLAPENQSYQSFSKITDVFATSKNTPDIANTMPTIVQKQTPKKQTTPSASKTAGIQKNVIQTPTKKEVSTQKKPIESKPSTTVKVETPQQILTPKMNRVADKKVINANNIQSSKPKNTASPKPDAINNNVKNTPLQKEKKSLNSSILDNNIIAQKKSGDKIDNKFSFKAPIGMTFENQFNIIKNDKIIENTNNKPKKIDQINFKEEYKNLVNLDNISLPVQFKIGSLAINKIMQFGKYINQQQFEGLSVDDRAKACMKFLVNEGLPLNIAAGVVGNLHHESIGFDTTATGDSRKAFGLAQWHPDRQWGIGNYLVDNKIVQNQVPSLFNKTEYEFKKLPKNTRIEYLKQNFSDYRAQLLGVLYELTMDGNGGHQLTKINSPANAATVFCNNFERPNKKLANVKGRVSYANKAYKMFAGNTGNDVLAKA